ncbi:agc protein kinase [Phaffia rhodozyma]|uniref:non-specific serine/threonine protein kinase n=1 Tax=Phaffia rhodozyma TaxID=264483 RepID=A0A0F7SVL8_PHARH|nr:agc protein kinase [Phaffia rhodozyma]
MSDIPNLSPDVPPLDEPIGSDERLLGSPSVPRPIPQHSNSFNSYTRPRLSQTSSSNNSFSPAPSDADSNSSPSSNSNSPRSVASGLPVTRSILGRQSPAKKTTGLPPSGDRSEKILDHGKDQSVSGAQSLEALVSPTSASTLNASLGLSLPSNVILPPGPSKRTFDTTPSFPSPLARASIVPRFDDSDEEDPNADIEATSLEGVPHSGFLFGPDGSKKARPRRTSTNLLRSGRAASPSTMLHIMANARQTSSGIPSSPGSEASSHASPTSMGDPISPGLTIRDRDPSRRSRQTSEGGSFRRAGFPDGGSSPSRSPTRSRRRSDMVMASSPDKSSNLRHPITISRPLPIASLTIPTPSSTVSPLNALPVPWGNSPTSSAPSSPTESNFTGAIRLQRVPTSVRLASDLMGSSPHSLSPLSSAAFLRRGSLGNPDALNMGALASSFGSTTERDPLAGTSNIVNPHTIKTPNPSPEEGHLSLPSVTVTPLSTPLVEQNDPMGTSPWAPGASTSLGAFSGRSPLVYARPSRSPIPAPSAFEPLVAASPASLKPSGLHHKYRTSVHETSSLGPLLGNATPTDILYGENLGDSKKEDYDPTEVARTIMNSRSAKVSKWKRKSQTSASSDMPDSSSILPRTPAQWMPPKEPSISIKDSESKSPHLLGEPLSRSSTVPRRLNERDVTDTPTDDVESGQFVLDRPETISGPSSQHYIEWVDWLDEYKQFKEAKIRAELQNFTMPTTSHPEPRKGEGIESESSMYSDRPSRQASAESSSDIGDVRLETLSPQISSRERVVLTASSLMEGNEGKRAPHRRTLSGISAGGQNLQDNHIHRVPSQRLANVFDRPRNFSSSTTDSRESTDSWKPKRNVGNKLEGWWKTVKSTLALSDHPHSKHTKITSKPSEASNQPSTRSLQSNYPSAIRIEPGAPSSSPITVPAPPSAVIGFFPSTGQSPRQPLKHRTSAYDSLRSLPSREALAPAVSLVSSLRPNKAAESSEQDALVPPLLRALSSKSDKTMDRQPSAELSLEARRRQPPLSLKFDKPQLRPTPTHSSSGHGSVSSTDRPLHRTLQSRTSSFGTDFDSSSSYNKNAIWAQTPSPLYALLPDDTRNATDATTPGMSSQSFNTAAIQREIRHRLTTQKEVCNKELNKIIHLITLFVEEKLDEVNEADLQADIDMDNLGMYSAMDSQSDFGGDESDRAEYVPARRRVSRPSSRRPSISLASSPAKRRDSLRPTDVGGLPAPRRRSRTQEQRFNQTLSSSFKPTSSNSSSRSTSRSRSPYLPQSSLNPDDNTGLSSPFLATLQEIIGIATEVLDMSISAMTARPGICPEYVQKVQQVGTTWDKHPDWPGRGWYVQLLLAVAGLSRVIEWWEAEKGFWNFADHDKEDEPLSFVIKPTGRIGSPVISPYARHEALPSSMGLGFGGKFEPRSSQFSSIGLRMDDSDLQFEGDKPSTVPKLDIGPPREDLKLQVEQAKTVNLVLELSLDGDIVEWINPAWQEVVGSDPGDVIGRPIHEYLAPADVSVFLDASRELLKDDSHTVEARFRLQVLPEASDEESDVREPGPVFIEMDGSGMLMRDRFNGEPSHSMWVIKPVALPAGAEVERANNPLLPLTLNFGVGSQRRAPIHSVSPFPHGKPISTVDFLCRICERQVPAWFFEKHNETCHEVHRLEADIGERNERIGEYLQQAADLANVLDRSQPSSPLAYRGVSVSYFPAPSSSPSKTSSSRPLGSNSIDHQRSIVHQVVDILQVCLNVSTPSIKEDATDVPIEEQCLLSPRSEDNMTLMNTWIQPTCNDPALRMLVEDTISIVRSKLNAVNRLRNTIVYSERVRCEWEDKVEKALCALSDGSDTDLSSDTPSDEDVPVERSETGFQGFSDSPLDISMASIGPLDQSLSPPTASSLPSSSPGSSQHRSSIHTASRAPTLPSILSTNEIPMERATLSVPSQHISIPQTESLYSSSPRSPLAQSIERSPTRSRRLSITRKGRFSVGSDAPLSPRLPSTTPTSRSTSVSIKDFEIIKPISKGAFGAVYLAKKTTTGDYFAIKMLKKADMISKNQITNVKAERKILMNQAESPYVVRLFYTFQNKHSLYLVMEYLPGGDLGGLVKKLGTLGEDWTKHFVAEIILGLESLHDKGIVHRDVKPDNLLIDAKGHLKLTDFGLSRIGLLGRQAGGSRFPFSSKSSFRGPLDHRSAWSRDHSIDSSDSNNFSPKGPIPAGASSLSQSYFGSLLDNDGRTSADESSRVESGSGGGLITPGTPAVFGVKPSGSDNAPISDTHKFVGTVDYVAPESILGLGGDNAAVDWWALGVMMYELLYGCPPFNDETPEKVFDNIISRRIVWPDPEDDEASPEARDLMERLMCTDPDQRLGAHGADEIKRHPFFDDINWDTISSEEGCFIPQVSENISTDYFDARGLVELPEELDSSNLAVDPSALNTESARDADDFGTFSFRNLWASKAANDQVVQDMKAQAEADALLPPSIESSQGSFRGDRRRSIVTSRKRAKGPLYWNENQKPNVPSTSANNSSANPPSPSASSSSGGSFGFVPYPVGHNRRTSDLDRVQADSDLSRKSSLPSRLRASSTSQASNDTNPSSLSPPSSLSSPQTSNMIATASQGRVQVLLAEDNPVSLKVACNILTKLGIECATVSSGSDALAVATTCAFDVLFLDVRLPHLDGDGVARYLKSVAGPNSETPIVAVTAVAEDDSTTLSEHGTLFSAVVSKPITRENVLAVLLKLGFKVENSAN